VDIQGRAAHMSHFLFMGLVLGLSAGLAPGPLLTLVVSVGCCPPWPCRGDFSGGGCGGDPARTQAPIIFGVPAPGPDGYLVNVSI